ncbi:MAG: rRNA maturation RNase YbeY [Pseudomonadota bacterium]
MSEEPPSCEVVVDAVWSDAGIDAAALVDDACGAVWRRLPEARALGPTEIGIHFADDVTVQRLNAAWRGHDRPTDVLSFPATTPTDLGPAPFGPVLLGDVVVGHRTCTDDAAALGAPLADHVRHLIVHGLLHLLHYDHQTPDDAARMEALEVAILADLGLPDPYAGRALLLETST